MRKRGLILIFALLITLIPFAGAEIVFSGNFGEYNLGASFNVEGYIDGVKAREIFNLFLDCGDSEMQLSARMFDVENKKYFFNEYVNLPFGYKGDCKFRATFNGESQDSDSFKISDNLKGGIFIVSPENLRLGDELKFDGDIFYLNNKDFSGIGIFSLKEGDKISFMDTFEIVGSVEYATIIENLPPGDYNLKLEVFDPYGNERDFEFGSVKINDDLDVYVNLDKHDYLPDEIIEIKGNVDINEYRITFEFDEIEYENSYEDKDFDYSLKLRSDIKSGGHNILVKVTDKFGNLFEEYLNFDVIPVPKDLEVKVDKENYLPEEIIEIFTKVSDQSGDVYIDDVNLIVLDSEKEKILEETVSSGSIYGLELPKHGVPGNYLIKVKSTDFEKEINVIVDEYDAMEVYCGENRLKINNVGNIPIKEEITIYLNGEIIPFDLSLEPSEIGRIDLRPYIENDGYHDIIVDYKGESYEVNVCPVDDDRDTWERITGGTIGSGGVTSWITYVIIVLIIVFVLYWFIFRHSSKSRSPNRDKGFREGQEKLKRIKSDRERKKPKKLFQAKDISESEAKQFRESMVKKMKE